jgi:5-methylcytosine-specific restriction endonuclease McrBC regulatory subunit McrC
MGEYLNTILKDLNFTHPENMTGEGVLKLFKNSRDLYPDFYNRERSMVVDAKYKRFKNNEISREDIYQVVTYMYRLKTECGILLYPSEVEKKSTINKMNIESYGGEKALFIIYGIKVPTETSIYNDYTICFKESEVVLKNYFQYEYFKNPEYIEL